MTKLPDFFHTVDIHTHCDSPGNDCIVCITPEQDFGQGCYYSVGIHPWNAGNADEKTFGRLASMATDNRVVAIGEAGLDALRGPDLEIQEHVFRRQAHLAEETGKPLIIHVVRSFNRLIELKKEMNPSVPWIIHGFRGKPQLAVQLVRIGFYLSLGKKFNDAVLTAVPHEFLLHESDAMPDA